MKLKLDKYLILTLALDIFAVVFLPSSTSALQMPQSGNDLAQMYGISAKAYVVEDVSTGQLLINQNENQQMTPASLTKLVTALVVLDTKPKLTKTMIMGWQDQTQGACSEGGACIRSASGIKFTVDGLFHAMLLPSANNAASALARSTGLSMDQFVARMNKKAVSLGATNSHFNEPTGMDPENKITAGDYAKIISAAFSNSYLRKIAGLNDYFLASTNSRKYSQTIKNTDKLLANNDLQIFGAKTGYLEDYNFAALLKYKNGPILAVVVLGEPHLYSAFDETQQLANLAAQAQALITANAQAGKVSWLRRIFGWMVL